MAKIQLNAASGGGSVAFEGPASLGSDKVIKFPNSPNVVIQVVTATNTSKGAEGMGTNTFRLGTAFNCDITPTSTSSKILVIYSISGSTEVNDRIISFKPVRSGTDILIGNAEGSRTRTSFGRRFDNTSLQTVSFSVLDSPNTTSSVSYSFRNSSQGGGGFFIRNGLFNDGNNADTVRGVCTITAMELSA